MGGWLAHRRSNLTADQPAGPTCDTALVTPLDEYLARTPASRALFERALGSLPG